MLCPSLGGNTLLSRDTGRIFVTVIALAALCSAANAGQTVYKWVDEDGHVHFSDSPPAESQTADTETMIIPSSPPPVAPAEKVKSPAAAIETDDNIQTEQPKAPMPQQFEKVDITTMSIADLNSRCDKARENMIAPLREAEIAKCKQDKREDPARCERFNADYGEGGRTVSGSIRPRMFDDLPECVEALQEKNRRGR